MILGTFNFMRISGSIIIWFFNLVIPLIILTNYANKYNNPKIGKSIFYKLPLISLLCGLIGAFIGWFVGAMIMRACSGEECLGVLGLLFLLAIISICFSLFLAFANYYFDSFYEGTFWKILCSITNFIKKIWIILFILFLIIMAYSILGGIRISSSI